MINLIMEQIKRRARIEHVGDVTKATHEYFTDHPEDWQRYRDEVTDMKKRGDDRQRVDGEMDYRTMLIAHRDNLDLENPAQRVAAQEKVMAEYPDLYKRYRTANSIHIGKSSRRTEV